jgi:hypothetical protein
VTYRDATACYGNWLRWAMAAIAAGYFVFFAAAAFMLHRGFALLTTNAEGATHFTNRFVLVQFASLPLNLVSLAYIGSLIAWIMNAGKFAEAHGWPAARSRTLGAFSVLIPIVNLWWPYEALRDAYPPGAHPPILLRWWLTYMIAPFAAGIFAILAAVVGGAALVGLALVVAAALLALPVVFGWAVIADISAMQRANGIGDGQ